MEKKYFYFNDLHRLEYEVDEFGGTRCHIEEKMGDRFVELGAGEFFTYYEDFLQHYELKESYFKEQARLSNEIMNCLDGKLNVYESIMLCEHTPQILQDVGLKDKPILFSQRHLKDGIHEKGKNPKWHGLDVRDFLDLENNMKSPALILDSFSDDDSILVITDTVDDDENPIMACIRANGKGQYQVSAIGANYLTSVYGKDNFDNFMQKSLSADFVLYADKEKIHNLERSSKLQLLDNFPNDYEFNKIIHKSNNVVNEQELFVHINYSEDNAFHSNEMMSFSKFNETISNREAECLLFKDYVTDIYKNILLDSYGTDEKEAMEKLKYQAQWSSHAKGNVDAYAYNKFIQMWSDFRMEDIQKVHPVEFPVAGYNKVSFNVCDKTNNDCLFKERFDLGDDFSNIDFRTTPVAKYLSDTYEDFAKLPEVIETSKLHIEISEERKEYIKNTAEVLVENIVSLQHDKEMALWQEAEEEMGHSQPEDVYEWDY